MSTMEWLDDDTDEPEEPEVDSTRFPLLDDEHFLIAELNKRLRSLLQLPYVSGNTIRQIGTVLFALERMPRATPGIAVAFSLVYRFNHESTGCDLFISESEFRLETGGNAYSPEVGSDSYSNIVFEMETSGFRRGSADSFEVIGWLNQFDEVLNLGVRIEIDYLGDDDDVDWSAEDVEEDEIDINKDDSDENEE